MNSAVNVIASSESKEPPETWLLKHRLEELGTTFRTGWDIYIKFYTVFITFDLTAMAFVGSLRWSTTGPASVLSLPRSGTPIHVLSIVFIGQSLLTAMTSFGMSLYTRHAKRDYDALECALLGSAGRSAVLIETKPLPTGLAQWSGVANAVAMLGIIVAWVYVGLLP